MAMFVQLMRPPLEQPLKGRPTGPFYVTLVESTLFDGICAQAKQNYITGQLTDTVLST